MNKPLSVIHIPLKLVLGYHKSDIVWQKYPKIVYFGNFWKIIYFSDKHYPILPEKIVSVHSERILKILNVIPTLVDVLFKI